MTVLRPEWHQLKTAAEWLRLYDGDPNPNDPAEQACHRTADWLLSLVAKAEEKAEENVAIRAIRKEIPSVTKAQAKAALRNFRGK